MLRKENRNEQGVIGKLNWNWKGPYEVVEVINPVTYRLKDEEGKVLANTAHSTELLKYEY